MMKHSGSMLRRQERNWCIILVLLVPFLSCLAFQDHTSSITRSVQRSNARCSTSNMIWSQTVWRQELRPIQRTDQVSMSKPDDFFKDHTSEEESLIPRRRTFLHASSVLLSSLVLGGTTTMTSRSSSVAWAAEEEKSRKSLESSLYTILRVREATEQETRLIKSGKFKDVQRANVKLACRFMLQNYRLADNFIAASTYLEGNRRYQATDAGQAVVQALQTILEYFDSADVQNLKVGSMDNMAGKEYIVINGLDAARNGIDRFLAFFPEKDVNPIKNQIAEENALNEKEFDPDLGVIINLKSVKD